MDQAYTIFFTLDACQDLEAAFDWIKDDRPDAARDFVVALRRRCEVDLAATPRMGVQLELANGSPLYALTCGHYRIFYGVEEDAQSVTIFRILHTSRNITHILKLSA